MHKELYYTLFESYLAYGVTDRGKASKSKLRLLFKAQKKAFRVVFGNKEQFLNKVRTCAKARPYPDQQELRPFASFCGRYISLLRGLKLNRTSKTEKMRSMISRALYIKSVFPLSGAKSIEQPRIKSSIKTRYLILQLDQ